MTTKLQSRWVKSPNDWVKSHQMGAEETLFMRHTCQRFTVLIDSTEVKGLSKAGFSF